MCWSFCFGALSHSVVAPSHSPVCPQVNTADAQVVAGPDEPRLQLKGSRVSLHRLLTPVPVRQRGPKAVPQQVILDGGWRVGLVEG